MTKTGSDGAGYLYDRVAQGVVEQIKSGALQPGDRAPSLRKMGQRLGVSVATVMQAYTALENRGYLAARPQSGFFVRARRRDAPAMPRRTQPRAQPRKVRIGDLADSILEAIRQPGIAPLGAAAPGAELLPARALNRAMNRALHHDAAGGVGYCPTQGREELRRQIAYRAVDLGCAIDPDDVVIVSGCTEALAISLRAVARPGDIIAVESPTYFFVLDLIEQLGMLALEICTDAESGLCLDALEAALDRERVRAVLTVANFQNPTGSLMPAENKERLTALLAERGVALIEDDIYGDLYFGAERPCIANRFDREGATVTCSSFSKTLAPGYPVGWILPGRYKSAVLRAKRVMSHTAIPTQLAIAEFLRSGDYDRHLRRLRRTYREQADKMRGFVARQFPPGTRMTRPRGGFVLWVELPAAVDAVALYERALEAGVSIAPGSLFSPSRKYRNFIRLSCGNLWDERIEQALTTVGRLANELATA